MYKLMALYWSHETLMYNDVIWTILSLNCESKDILLHFFFSHDDDDDDI